MRPTSSRPLVIAALVALLGACGSDSPAPLAPVPPATILPARLADLRATSTSPEADRNVSCRENILARVVITNGSHGPVTVGAVRHHATVLSGACTAPADFTYPVLPRVVDAHATALAMGRPLYSGGSGCCRVSSCAGQCSFQESFQVLTDVGAVPAGQFTFSVTFSGCDACPGDAADSADAADASAAASGPGCRPGSIGPPR